MTKANEDAVRDAFRRQAESSIARGSPFAPLLAGLLVIAARTNGKPLALYEAGASAGLLLVFDRYSYRLGETATGDQASPVVVAPKWEGASPGATEFTIQSRQGSDLDPLD